MKPTRSNDDEPDVIDLTTYYGYHGSVNFPIRPPSPFADSPRQSQMFFQDNETNAMVTWSIPAKQQNLIYKINNSEKPILTSTDDSQAAHANSKWRRTLNKLLRRTKSIERKEVIPSSTSNFSYPYNFGLGEKTRTDSLTSRTSGNKRVHWFDDDTILLNASHRFVEYLKLFVQNHIEERDEKYHYFDDCQRSLDQLQSLSNYLQIKQAFEDMIVFAEQRNHKQLVQQQVYIESLVSRFTCV